MESGKIVFLLILLLATIMFGIGYDEVSSKANFKQEKGAIVVLIKASKLSPCDLQISASTSNKRFGNNSLRDEFNPISSTGFLTIFAEFRGCFCLYHSANN